MNRLKGMRVYTAGSMDRAPDGGVGWRTWITPKLQKFGCAIINPCQKPIDIASEDIENRQYREQLLKDGKYDELSEQMKILRIVDLRCVDISDFVIVHFDTKQYMCGTLEEIVTANREKKPILIYSPHGINEIYHWMFGMLPHKLFFDDWDKLFQYLEDIDSGKNNEHLKRWVWFDYSKLEPPHLQPTPNL